MTQSEDREAQTMDIETAKPPTTVACNGSTRVEVIPSFSSLSVLQLLTICTAF